MNSPPTDLPSDQPPPLDVGLINRQMAKGAGWMIAMRLAIRCVGLISTIILARLLVPADFGLVALATMLFGILEISAAFGFDLALIREQKAERSHYDTVWTLTLIRGIVIALILVASADFAAAFFEEPRLAGILHWLAAASFVQAFSNIGVVQFRKEMEFGREFRYRVMVKLCSFAVTVALAFLWRDYWALVAGIVAGRCTQVLLSYYLHPYRPRLALSRCSEILHFSKWLAVNNVLHFVTNRADTFIIGKITGVDRIGLYTVAYEVSNMPTTELVWPIQRAVFPGYAKLSGEYETMRKAYLNVLGLALMLAAPMGAGVGLVADPLVKVFLGEKWLEAIPLVQILAVFGVLRVGQANAGSVFLALGKPHILTILVTIGISIKIPLLIWGTMTAGAIGAAWALIATASIGLTLTLVTISHQLQLRPAAIFAVVWRTLTALAVMGVVVHVVQDAWPDAGTTEAAALQLCTLAVIGALTYVGVLIGTWRLSGSPDGAEQQTLDLLRSKLAKRRTL